MSDIQPVKESKIGRPSHYDEKVKPFLNDVMDWVLLGYTNKEIAEKLDISTSTFCEYQREIQEFSQAINKYKALPNANVTNALYKRATGYQYEELQTVTKPAFDSFGKPVYDRDGKQMMIEHVTRTIKELPPDTKAIQFWKLNRDRANWNVAGGMGTNISIANNNQQLTMNNTFISNVSDEDLDAKLQNLLSD